MVILEKSVDGPGSCRLARDGHAHGAQSWRGLVTVLAAPHVNLSYS